MSSNLSPGGTHKKSPYQAYLVEAISRVAAVQVGEPHRLSRV